MTLLSYSTPALQHPRQPPQQYTFTAVPKTGSGVKISRPAPQQLERFADEGKVKDSTNLNLAYDLPEDILCGTTRRNRHNVQEIRSRGALL